MLLLTTDSNPGSATWRDASVVINESVSGIEDWTARATSGSTGWAQDLSGAGAAAAISYTDTTPTNPGIVALGTGTTAGGRAIISLGCDSGTANNGTIRVPTSGSIYCEWVVKIPILETVGENFFVNVGYNDRPNSGGNGNTSISFRADGLTWFAFSRQAGVDLASVDTLIPVTTAFTRLRVEVNAITGAAFSIGASESTLAVVATIPLVQLPTLAGDRFGLVGKIQKQAGATNRQLLVDLCTWGFLFPPTAR
jgi:hypothetical protein